TGREKISFARTSSNHRPSRLYVRSRTARRGSPGANAPIASRKFARRSAAIAEVRGLKVQVARQSVELWKTQGMKTDRHRLRIVAHDLVALEIAPPLAALARGYLGMALEERGHQAGILLLEGGVGGLRHLLEERCYRPGA